VHVDLLSTACRLIAETEGRVPTDVDLRRAVSTAYYAMFHYISEACVVSILGQQAGTLARAKAQVYRSINHRDVEQASKRAKDKTTDFPKGISDFAIVFLNMHKARAKADYDPTSEGNFNLPQVRHKIGECEAAIRRYAEEPELHRRAFAAMVAIKSPHRLGG
jgi:hypothetical protein